MISILEGLSLLGLLIITMPLKYIYELPGPNALLGMVHGLLFILYVFLAFLVKQRLNWSIKTLLVVLVCSVIPLGTFWMDARYIEPELKKMR